MKLKPHCSATWDYISTMRNLEESEISFSFCDYPDSERLLKFIFIGVELLYNAVLVSATWQNKSTKRVHMSPPLLDFLYTQLTVDH